MSSTIPEPFWTELLQLIRRSKVIPVVGPGAITCEPEDQLLYPPLAAQLAQDQGLGDPGKPPPASIPEVVHLLHQRASLTKDFPKQLQTLQMNLLDYLEQQQPAPGANLRRLAAIPRFNFFLAASCDSLLVRAVETERPAAPASENEPSTCALAPTDDVPAPFEKLQRPFVYPLFGCIASGGELALWDDDTFEFLLRLDQQLHNAPNLRAVLKDAHFLILGLNRADWLLRLLVRIADGKRLAERDHEIYLADDLDADQSQRIIALFNPHTSLLKMVSIDPRAFIAELADRWEKDAARRAAQRPVGAPAATIPGAFTAPLAARPGCIFVSYASPDRAIAESVTRQLESAGGFTWFDRWDIKPGGKWDNIMRDAVQKHCGVFVSLTSANTETRVAGYYIQERNWAAKRAATFAERALFYFPVRIDDSSNLIPDNEPVVAIESQGTSAPGGQLPEALLEQIIATQRTYCQQQGIVMPKPRVEG